MAAFGTVGASALNFGLWGVAVIPAWFVVKEVGVTFFGRGEFETRAAQDLAEVREVKGTPASGTDSKAASVLESEER